MKPNFTEEARIWERGVVPAKTLAMLLREMWERGEVAGAGDRAALLAVVEAARLRIGHESECTVDLGHHSCEECGRLALMQQGAIARLDGTR